METEELALAAMELQLLMEEDFVCVLLYVRTLPCFPVAWLAFRFTPLLMYDSA